MKKESVKKQKRCIITKEEFHDKIISLIDAVGLKPMTYDELLTLANEKHVPYVTSTLAALKGIVFAKTEGHRLCILNITKAKETITFYFTHSLLLTLRKRYATKKKDMPTNVAVAGEPMIVTLKRPGSTSLNNVDKTRELWVSNAKDEQLIAELKKRGYKVMKSKCTWEEC